MTVLGLTPKQHAALKFIEEYISIYGYSPTYLEISEALKLKSTSNIHYILRRLEARGHIVWQRATARSVALSPQSMAV
jgi:repressor LexA